MIKICLYLHWKKQSDFVKTMSFKFSIIDEIMQKHLPYKNSRKTFWCWSIFWQTVGILSDSIYIEYKEISPCPMN